MDLLYSLSGLLVGVLVGATGMGGGALLMPILVFGFGVPPLVAVGTDLLHATANKFAGLTVHAKCNHVNYKITAALLVGSIPAAFVTIGFLKHTATVTEQLNEVVLLVTGVVLLFCAVIMWVKTMKFGTAPVLVLAHGTGMSGPSGQAYHEETSMLTLSVTVLLGALLGSVVSLTSVGAGTVGIVILTYLYPYLSAKKIIGTDIAHAFPLTLVAGVGHFTLGNVDMHMLVWLLLGSIPGVIIGAKLTGILPDRFLKRCLAVIVCVVGLKFVSTGVW